MNDFEIFYYKAVSELEKVKSKRSYKERTIFDREGKKMRLKLEKGFISGINSAIKVLKKVKKDVDLLNAASEVEHKERTFV